MERRGEGRVSRSMLRFAEVIKMTDREVRRQRGAGCKRRTLKKKTMAARGERQRGIGQKEAE